MTPARRNATKGKRMSELTDGERADARECWLRDNAEHFPHGIPQYLTFLLDRLDERDARIAQLEDRLRENGNARMRYRNATTAELMSTTTNVTNMNVVRQSGAR